MTRRWKIWAVFTGVVVLGLASLVVMTVVVVGLRHQTATDAANAQHRDEVRLAISNMEAWLLPLLAREADRAPQEYQPFYELGTAFNATLLNPISLNQFVVPSPLLISTDPFIIVHFEFDQTGKISSPEVPTRPSYRDLAEAAGVRSKQIERSKEALDRVDSVLHPMIANRSLLARIAEMEDFYTIGSDRRDGGVGDLAQSELDEELQTYGSIGAGSGKRSAAYEDAIESADWTARSQRAELAQKTDSLQLIQSQADAPAAAAIAFGAGHIETTGGLVPLWQQTEDGKFLLFYVRRYISADGRECIQGLMVDWALLQDALLEQIVTPLPGAKIDPWRGTPQAALGDSGFIQAGLPSIMGELVDNGPRVIGDSSWSTTNSILVLCWVAAVIALIAIGLMLRSSVLYGERRSRFASAVTHELRTPLTTFRMYSEMLADGVVSETNKRQQYLETLRSESDRLSGLVENVLAYARLEEGRHRAAAREVEYGQLIESLRIFLSRRCDVDGRPFLIESQGPETAMLSLDVESIEQVLFNLVDNACKYGVNSNHPEIEVRASLEDQVLRFEVRDYGPGIDQQQTRAVFKAFDRGAKSGDPAPGIGLGLALARQMAAFMNGTLALVDTDGQGALFVLTIPTRHEQRSAKPQSSDIKK